MTNTEMIKTYGGEPKLINGYQCPSCLSPFGIPYGNDYLCSECGAVMEETMFDHINHQQVTLPEWESFQGVMYLSTHIEKEDIEQELYEDIVVYPEEMVLMIERIEKIDDFTTGVLDRLKKESKNKLFEKLNIGNKKLYEYKVEFTVLYADTMAIGDSIDNLMSMYHFVMIREKGTKTLMRKTKCLDNLYEKTHPNPYDFISRFLTAEEKIDIAKQFFWWISPWRSEREEKIKLRFGATDFKVKTLEELRKEKSEKLLEEGVFSESEKKNIFLGGEVWASAKDDSKEESISYGKMLEEVFLDTEEFEDGVPLLELVTVVNVGGDEEDEGDIEKK